MPLSLRLVTSLALLSSIRPAASPKVQPSLAAPSTTPRAPRRAYHTSFQQQQRAYGGSGSVNSMAPPLSYPRPTVIEPKAGGQPSAAVFIMHGLGDTAAGWEDVAYQLRSALPHARFILPTAPTRPISLNGGYPMPGWYDIHSLDSLQGRADGPGVAASADYISGLMDSLAAGIPSDRVVMAGFSQGGAMALAMLGRVPGKLAGVISMSGYLPLATGSPSSPPALPLHTPANGATPVLFCHGDADEVVRHEFGVLSADALKAAGVPVTFKTYRGMGHSACPAELGDVADFLTERLPPA